MLFIDAPPTFPGFTTFPGLTASPANPPGCQSPLLISSVCFGKEGTGGLNQAGTLEEGLCSASFRVLNESFRVFGIVFPPATILNPHAVALTALEKAVSPACYFYSLLLQGKNLKQNSEGFYHSLQWPNNIHFSNKHPRETYNNNNQALLLSCERKLAQ